MRLSYPAELPVSQRKDDILAAIRDNQVVIALVLVIAVAVVVMNLLEKPLPELGVSCLAREFL